MKTVLYFQFSFCNDNNTKFEGVCRYAKAARWQIRPVPYADAAANRVPLQKVPDAVDVRALIDFWKPDGAIVDCGPNSASLGPKNFPGLPVVFLDCMPMKDAIVVTYDSTSVVDLAVRELLGLDCVAYGYVPFVRDTAWSRERGAAFVAGMELNGRSVSTFDAGGESLFSRKFRSGLSKWLGDAPHPLGVFAANDFMGEQVISCASRHGLKIPDDVAVVGVDNDLQICERTVPALTSVIPDFDKAGYLAAELLAQKMSAPRRRIKGSVFGAVGIRRRESTRKYVRHDDRVVKALNHIRRHACEGIGAKDVVALMGCSRRTAEMRFREVTGHSILDEIHSVRLEHAKTMLLNSRVSVAEAAASCGYSTSEQLRRLFLAADGLPPCKWRKR